MTRTGLFATVAIAAALLGACATSTPYAPSIDGGYGYSETQIEDDRFRVAFSGNSLTELETVQNYVLFRAADLTDQRGFDWFEVITRDTDRDSRFVDTGFDRYGYGYGVYHRYYHPAIGWRPYYGHFGRFGHGDVNLREVTRYESFVEIVMGKGDKPDRVSAYSAPEVLRNLRGAITYPEP